LDTIEEAGDHEALTITVEDVEVTEQSLIMTVVAVYRCDRPTSGGRYRNDRQ
jgi:hypothetical protein